MTQFGVVTVAAWPFQVMIVFALVGLALLVYRLMDGGLHHRRAGQGRSGHRGFAQRVLDARYARGEISAQEYIERLRMLSDED